MSDIFLSYANEDRERVRPLAAALNSAGWSVFWDRKIPVGKSWNELLEEEIDSARSLVIVWSENSIRSKWVKEEANEGLRRNLPIFPILVDEILPPLGFRDLQAADLSRWDGTPAALVFQGLISDIASVLGQPQGYGIPGAKAAKTPEVAEEKAKAAAVESGAVQAKSLAEPVAAPEKIAPAAATEISQVSGKRRFWYLGAGLALAMGLLLVLFLVRSTPKDNQKITHEGQPDKNNLSKISPEKPKTPALESVQVLLPSGPPSNYFVINSIGRQPDASLRLTQVSEKPNNITDTEEWWVANRLPSLTFAEKDLPAGVPKEFRGNRVVKVIRSQPILAIYGTDLTDGRYLLGISPQSGQIEFAFDFSTFQWPPNYEASEREFVKMATTWAQVDKGILYVAHGHRTYAKSSHGYNAFISAFDVSSGLLLWRSQPLVSNADNFVMRDGAIIAGYGFTAEKHYLYILNQADGRVLQKVPVASGPDYLVEKGDELYVRTYNRDYIFRFTNN